MDGDEVAMLIYLSLTCICHKKQVVISTQKHQNPDLIAQDKRFADDDTNTKTNIELNEVFRIWRALLFNAENICKMIL